MARIISRGKPTTQTTLRTCCTTCPECTGTLWSAYFSSRTVATLAGLPESCTQRRCLRLIRRDGRFWVESLGQGGCLSVGGKPLKANLACPLADGVTVGCEARRAAFGAARQVGL